MLIRSGLIQSVDAVNAATFARYWREVHGPLAAKLPNLRGYVQNHVVARGRTREGQMHRIDGISQLWFDNVDAMSKGMASPENDACIADIAGFLSRVTLAIQDPGSWATRGIASAGAAKVLAVYVGEGDVEPIRKDLDEALARNEFAMERYRINRVVAGNFIVDPSIARSEAPLLAVVEAFFAEEAGRTRFLEANALNASTRLSPAAVVAVTPYVYAAIVTGK